MKTTTRWLALTLCLLGAMASQAQEPVWIDVRSAGEYQDGHLEGATLIPHDGIEQGIARLQLSTDTPIYLYCRSGRRSGFAKERLEAEGYTRVINVGGLEDARQYSERLQLCANDTTQEECPVAPEA